MMIKYLLQKPIDVLLYAVLMIVGPWSSVQLTYRTAMVIDAAQAQEPVIFINALWITGLFFVINTVLDYGLRVMKKALLFHARTALKNDMFSNVTGISRTSFLEQTGGEHIGSFSNDISILEYQYFSAILNCIEGIVSFISYFSAILSVNRVFAFVVVLSESSGFFICILLKKRNFRLNQDYITALGSFTQRVRETFRARNTIQNYKAEEGVSELFGQSNRDAEVSKTMAEVSVRFSDAFAHFIRCMGAYAIVAIGASLMLDGQVDFSSIYVAYSFANTLSTPVKAIIYSINDLHSVRPIHAKIAKIAVAQAEEDEKKADMGPFCGVEFQNVSVAANGKRLLSQVNCSFLPGKKYLIIGDNGSGKSTMTQLIARYRDQYEGKIVLGGRDVRELSYQALCQHVVYISESAPMLSDTVYNNITLYRSFPEEDVYRAVKSVNLNVPLDRMVIDGGKNISSGERRRIEIARTLVAQPEMLIVDEAISTLDIETAYQIEKLLLSLDGKTVIFVAHNFSGLLLDQYDGILLLHAGELTAMGTHRELWGTCPSYRELIALKCGAPVN